MAYNKPTANQISLGSTTNLDQVINPSGVWIGSPTGLQGATGSQGVQGTQGLQGLQGTAGVIGVDGSQGATGAQGFNGSNGAQGTTGAQGVQGTQGAQGPGGLTTLDATTLSGVAAANVVYGDNSSASRTAPTTQDIYDRAMYKSGHWEVQGASWTPDTGWWWGMTNAHTSNSPSYNYSGQLAFQNSSVAEVYIRSVSGGSPSGWRRLLSLQNIVDLDVQIDSLGIGTAASGTTGEIRATNNITAYYSDMRLKDKLYNIPDALGKVMSLSGFFFTPNRVAQDLGYEYKQEVGVSAQEVEAVLPEAVAPAPISDEYLTVRYEKLVPLLIEAIKELKREVDELKAKVQ